MLARLTCLLVLVLACSGMMPASARAEATDIARDSRAAKQLYRQAVDAYADKRYEAAIALFLRADELGPSPAHSYNIARAYEALKRESEAVKWYRDYLQRAAPAPDAAAVQQRVALLEADAKRSPAATPAVVIGSGASPAAATKAAPGSSAPVVRYRRPAAPAVKFSEAAAAHDAAAQDDQPSATTDTASSAGSVQETIGIVSLVGGGVALASSLVFELMRRDAESEARKSSVQIAYADKVDTMQSHQLASRMLLGSGAGLAVLGTLLLLTAPDAASVGDQDTRLAVACNLRGCSVNASGRY